MAKRTQEELQDMKFGQLVKIASSEGVYQAGMTREAVIEAILNVNGTQEASAPADEATSSEAAPAAQAEESKEEKVEEKAETKKPAKPKKEKKEKQPKEKKERKPRATKTIEDYVKESGVKQNAIDKVLNDANLSHSDKIRGLFDLGLKVPRAIASLTGRHYSFVYEVLCKYRATFVLGKLVESIKSTIEGKKLSTLSEATLTKTHKEQAEVHKAAYIEFGLGDNRQSDVFTEADYKRVGKNAAEKHLEGMLDVPEDKPIPHKEMEKLVAIFYGK